MTDLVDGNAAAGVLAEVLTPDMTVAVTTAPPVATPARSANCAPVVGRPASSSAARAAKRCRSESCEHPAVRGSPGNALVAPLVAALVAVRPPEVVIWRKQLGRRSPERPRCRGPHRRRPGERPGWSTGAM